MLNKTDLIEALKSVTASEIYRRGVDYYRNGDVLKCSAELNEDGQWWFSGKVRGSTAYHLEMIYDSQNTQFVDIDCNCPYGDVCKHAVALVLKIADSYSQTTQATQADGERTKLEAMLREIGFETQNIPEDLLSHLLKFQKKAQKKVTKSVSKQKPQKKPVPVHPEEYAVILYSYSGFSPVFCKKENPFVAIFVSDFLKMGEFTQAQRAFIKYASLHSFDLHQASSLEIKQFFSLLQESGFEVYKDIYRSGNRLEINAHPPKLKAELAYEPRAAASDPKKIHHRFFFRIPKTAFQNIDPWYSTPFLLHGWMLLNEKEKTLQIHELTDLLAGLFIRLQPSYDYAKGRSSFTHYQTELIAEEVFLFETLVTQMQAHFDLLSCVPDLTVAPASQMCQPVFLVRFDSKEDVIEIDPVIDYGFVQQHISETISWRKNKYEEGYVRREALDPSEAHLIDVSDKTIFHAPINEQRELAFYEDLHVQREKMGFTKLLKCQKNGKKAIQHFLQSQWFECVAYAQKNQYPILFTQETLPLAQQPFRADFDIDFTKGEDLLSFQVECYCADQRVDTKMLLDYVAGRTSVIRGSDGTPLALKNSPELAGFIRLLKSFREREKGLFEGALYHAPELQYVVTNSSYYNHQQSKSFQALKENLEQGKPVRAKRLPARFERILRPYQKEGVQWLYFLRSYHFGGILADDMGLGKTLQTLVVLSCERVKKKPSLILCPKTLLYNWQAEASKFTPELSVLVYEGSPTQRKALRSTFGQYDLILMGYATLKTDQVLLTQASRRFNYVVLDEAQAIKNHASKTAQFAKKLHTDYRLALTGTPLENSVSELWSMFDFLMPGFLGSHEDFKAQFQKPIMEWGDADVLQHLRKKVACFMLRRTKAEVLTTLPAKIEQENICSLGNEQKMLYQQILQNVRAQVFDAVEEKGFKQAQIHIFAGLTKLRQVCNHPSLLLADQQWRKYASAKLETCLELVREIVQNKRKVLIFSQFTHMLDIVSEALQDEQIEHAYLSGKTRNRQQVIESFQQDSEKRVFLISIKTGGVGLNLTVADTVIIFDPWWNPSVENQAVDRTHRIGQEKSVHVHRLLTIGTIEEKIQSIKKKKQHLFDAVVGESKDVFKKLTWDDVKELFSE